jgi:hypothetical protein
VQALRPERIHVLRSLLARADKVIEWRRSRVPADLPGMVLFSPHFSGTAALGPREIRMRKTAAIVTLALSLISSVAMAQERGGDAALGALSGALVLGPIGAVAGAVVGYAAGPSIAHSWGLRRSGTARQGGKSARREARLSPDSGQPAPNNQAGPPPAAKAPSPSPKTASTVPPVQGLE